MREDGVEAQRRLATKPPGEAGLDVEMRDNARTGHLSRTGRISGGKWAKRLDNDSLRVVTGSVSSIEWRARSR